MTRRARSLAAPALALALAAGCSEPAGPPRPEPRPVVREALAALEAARPPAPPAPAPADADHVAGLVQFLTAARGRERELPLLEVAQLGDAATPHLAALAANGAQQDGERLAAVELLASVGTPAAAERLLDLLEKAPEPWLRAHAAWRLGEVGQDRVVPPLILRLRYETDPDTTIWIAAALGAYRNDAGLEPLWALVNRPPTAELAASAEARLAELAQAAGAADPVAHWELYSSGDPQDQLVRPTPSAALRLGAWRWIEQLSGAHFQLRGVDDARYVLVGLGPWVDELLCEALEDEDVYVRVFSAQCLERRGRRAFEAGPSLLAGLEDPALAPAAAAALGAIGYPTAEPRLCAMLAADVPHEQRAAAVRALGRLALPQSIPALEALLVPDEPLELRQAAALALVELGRGADVAPALVAWMRDPTADRHAAEAGLERWLVGSGAPAAAALLERWRALAPPPGIIPTAAQDEERLEARAALVEELLAAGGGSNR